MLVHKEDLEQFNSMVKPVEEEAYDILKRRSRTLVNKKKKTLYCYAYDSFFWLQLNSDKN